MIKKKVNPKAKTKLKAKKVSKKATIKVKNPVYLDFTDKLRKLYRDYWDLKMFSKNFVSIHSNTGIIYGFLIPANTYDSYSFTKLLEFGEKILEYLSKVTFTIKADFHQMPNQNDLSLIAENDDYLGNKLFWDEHDEFKKDSFKKLTNFQFILGNVDKVDGENNRIYVRRLKQVKSK
jgi:hypothetical protein